MITKFKLYESKREVYGYEEKKIPRKPNVDYITGDGDDQYTAYGVIGRSTCIYSIRRFVNDGKDVLETPYDINLNKFMEEIFLGKKVGFTEYIDVDDNTGGKNTVLTVNKVEVKPFEHKGNQVYFNGKVVNPWSGIQVVDFDPDTGEKPEHKKLELEKTISKYNL